MGQYNQAYKLRQKSKDKSHIEIEGPNIIDESGDNFPNMPAKPSPQVPTEDSFRKFRTEQA
jgi:hypothetical protein